jgi:hypothetical protein
MARFCFYIAKLGFLPAQLASWYIILSYCLLILPSSEPIPASSSLPSWVSHHRIPLNHAIIVVNFVIHLVLISLHQYSHWKVFLTDPGYFSSFYSS